MTVHYLNRRTPFLFLWFYSSYVARGSYTLPSYYLSDPRSIIIIPIILPRLGISTFLYLKLYFSLLSQLCLHLAGLMSTVLFLNLFVFLRSAFPIPSLAHCKKCGGFSSI